jgi:translation initiation factor eIF-2B subunit gamma
VEADEDMTGSTAKLDIPKARLREGSVVVRTEWSDVHVYSFAPWVRKLIIARTTNLSSIQKDLLPLLVARQFRGKKATFGKASLESLTETKGNNGDEDPAATESSSSSISVNENDKSLRLLLDQPGDEPYLVQAMLLPPKTALRANTISAYLFACKESVANGASLSLPEGSKWNGKFQTLTLQGTSLGSKINMKSSTVGKSCYLGDMCRLNNVIIMDNVSIGENCSLQNTLIGYGAKLGKNCSLNDCQVGPGTELPAGTKEKEESFMVRQDVMDADMIL